MIKVVAFDLWGSLLYLKNGWKTFNQLKPIISVGDEEWRDIIKPLFLCKNHPNINSFLTDLTELTKINLVPYRGVVESQLKKDILDTQLYPDTLSTLEEITKRNKKIAVVSNQCSFYKTSFSNLNLDKYFDYFLFSCDLGIRKPSLGIYQHLLNQTGVKPEEILFVGDNEKNDYFVPLSVGFRAFHLNREQQTLKDVLIDLS